MGPSVNIGATIRRSIVCPHCWREFPPGQIRFISESQGLRGDPIAGPTEQIRFRAMRFDAAGNALDPDGARCSRMACPNCHSEFARALVEIPSIPISIVGAPSSGKTNLLASGLWGLAQRARDFGFSIVDADPRFNASIHRNESILFSGCDPNADVTLPKTDVGGTDLYRTVRIAGVEEMVPKPSYYIVSHDDNDRQSVMVLYDNAGEHFLPGSRVAGSESATRHLERSSAIIMVFDPLQDMRFRKRYGASADTEIAAGHQRQELVFAEAIARIRRLRGLASTTPIDIPVIIALRMRIGRDWRFLRQRSLNRIRLEQTPPKHLHKLEALRMRQKQFAKRGLLRRSSPSVLDLLEYCCQRIPQAAQPHQPPSRGDIWFCKHRVSQRPGVLLRSRLIEDT